MQTKPSALRAPSCSSPWAKPYRRNCPEPRPGERTRGSMGDSPATPHGLVVSPLPCLAKSQNGGLGAENKAKQVLNPGVARLGWRARIGSRPASFDPKRQRPERCRDPAWRFPRDRGKRHANQRAVADAGASRAPLDFVPSGRNSREARLPKRPSVVTDPTQPGEVGQREIEPFRKLQDQPGREVRHIARLRRAPTRPASARGAPPCAGAYVRVTGSLPWNRTRNCCSRSTANCREARAPNCPAPSAATSMPSASASASARTGPPWPASSPNTGSSTATASPPPATPSARPGAGCCAPWKQRSGSDPRLKPLLRSRGDLRLPSPKTELPRPRYDFPFSTPRKKG